MNRRLFVALLAVALPLVAACSTTPVAPPPMGPPPVAPIVITSLYHPQDLAWAMRPGTNGIHGLSPMGYSCAGLAVGLTPDSPYSRERIAKLYGSTIRADKPVAEIRNRPIANDNPDLAKFVRATRCDAAGRFVFSGLPDGSYFLIAQVTSSVGPMALMRHVVLRGGDIEPVQLTIR